MTKWSRLAIVGAAILTILLAIVARPGSDETPPAPGHPTSVATRAATGGPALAVVDASIAGTVRDDHGDPIHGARVCATPVESASTATRCVEVQVDGNYRLDVPAGELGVWASARGRRPETVAATVRVADGQHRDDVDLVLAAGGAEVHGTITDGRARGIAHARVVIGGLMTETDDTGRYSLWVRRGWVLVRASADGFASLYRVGDAPGQIDAVLTAGARLGGTVVDASGAPVAGAFVDASHTDSVRDGLAPFVDPVISDDHGRFAFTGLLPGRYEVNARARHGSGIAAETPVALGSDVEGVVVRLSPGFEVAGRVSLPGGDACPDPSLWLEDARIHMIAATRDADGMLRVGGLPPGSYAVHPSCAGYVASSGYDAISITDHDVDATWLVSDGATLRGRIVTQHGRAVAGVDVYASGIGWSARDQDITVVGQTTSDGTYEIRGVPPGHYIIAAKAWSSSGSQVMSTATLDVHATEVATHNFIVDDNTGTIDGRIVDGDGRIPRKVSVVIKSDDSKQDNSAVHIDDAGRFFVDGLLPGVYHVTVQADDGELSIDGGVDGARVEVRGGTTTQPRLVVDAPKGVIRGRVVDDRGMAVTDATVALTTANSDVSYHFESEISMPTGVDGRFEASHLAAKSYHVRAFRRDGVDAGTRDVAIGGDITIVLPASATIAGVAHRAAGNVGDLEIRVIDRLDRSVIRSQTFAGTNGHFEILGVPPGAYVVSVDADGSWGTAEVEVRSGQRRDLDVELANLATIVGRVVDVRTGRPVPGVAMSAGNSTVSNRSHYGDTTKISDEAGRFTITDVPLGSVIISGRVLRDSPPYAWIEVLRDVGDVSDLGDIPIMSTASDVSGNCDCNVVIAGTVSAPRSAVVQDLIENGAADLAGIVAGDVITRIDGVDTTGRNAERAAMLLHGPKGSSVEVQLQRGITATLVRH